MKQIRNCVIVLPDKLLSGYKVLFTDRICAIVPDNGEDGGFDAGGGYVIPGMIDLHIHGYGGNDASDGNGAGILRMSRLLPENGVTAFLPTVMTLAQDALMRALDGVREAMKESEFSCSGSRILGAHLEGPCLNPIRAGAQKEEHMRALSPDFLREYADVIRILTLAPERDDAMELIRSAPEGMLVSVGHSDASFTECKSAFDAGARHVTHLFNAMSGVNHREPGVAAAALSDSRVTAELIADGHHVSPFLFPMIHHLKGERLVLITDCTRAGGMGEGTYTLGGRKFRVTGGKCLLPDGTLAGSVLRMNEAVRNLVNAGISVPDAVKASTLAPARAIGLDSEIGSITPGKRADLVVLGRDFSVRCTIVGGVTIYDTI